MKLHYHITYPDKELTKKLTALAKLKAKLKKPAFK
jgi:hypothetical protein